MTARRGRQVALAPEHLPTRVRWLGDARVRDGITIDFVPTLSGTQQWFRDRDLRRRWDGVHLDDAGVPVAMCGLTGIDNGTADLYLYVDPDRHRQGWGTAALDALVEQSAAHGVTVLSLTVDAGNTAARALYRRGGFDDVGHEPGRPDRRRMSRRTGP